MSQPRTKLQTWYHVWRLGELYNYTNVNESESGQVKVLKVHEIAVNRSATAWRIDQHYMWGVST